MGLDEIKSEILKEAQDKADKIEKEAEQEKQEILEEAEEEAERIHEEMEHQLEEEKESYRKKALSGARMKAKEEKMNAKQEEIQNVFKEFRNYLGQLTEGEKKKFVDSCLEKVEFDVGKIQGSKKFENSVDHEFEELDSAKGIKVISEDGEKMQSFTFDKIMEQMKQENRKEVADILF